MAYGKPACIPWDTVACLGVQMSMTGGLSCKLHPTEFIAQPMRRCLSSQGPVTVMLSGDRTLFLLSPLNITVTGPCASAWVSWT